MKKIEKRNQLLGAVLTVTACCALTVLGTTTPADASEVLPSQLNNNGAGWNSRQIFQQQMGTDATHDADMMRYDLNKRRSTSDYYQYENQRYGTGGSAIDEQSRQNYNNQQGSYGYGTQQATVSDVGSKGVYVNSIEVSPSEILTREEINSVIGKYVGRNVFMSDIQAAIDGLNNLYAQKGFVTARAYLPEQTVSNGNIKIELIESKIGDITVTNNKYTTSGYILKRMPEKQGELFDIVELEKDVLDFNRYHDGVNLTANLKAGSRPGTTDIELVAGETFPFHVIGMMDNAGRRNTGVLRGGPAIVADSLFHHRDQLSLGTYFSKGTVSPFFDYSFPINKKDGRIGFSYSSSFAKVLKPEELRPLNLKSYSYIYSLYYDQPLVRRRGVELKSYMSLNYKRARSFADSGIPEIDAWIKDVDQVTSVDAGFNLRKDTKYGIWYLNQMAALAVPIFDSESSYFKISGSLLRLHDFSHGIIGQLRSSYQVVPNSKHIPYLDQFQVGGLATVRGYSEGVMIGKNGYYVSGELMFPIGPRYITNKEGVTHPCIGNYLKGAIFADTAGIFPYYNDKTYLHGNYFLASVGAGVRVQLPGDLSARLYWGFPLVNNAYEQHRHMGRFHFELTFEPDFDALLSKRAPKQAPPQQAAPAPAPVEKGPNNYDDIRHYDYLLDGGATL